MVAEEWKEIKDFPGYKVSNYGRVFSDKINKQLRACISNHGYKYVCLRKDNKNYCKTMHNLVAEAFIPNPNNYYSVTHIDKNKTNNFVDNLKWVDRKYPKISVISDDYSDISMDITTFNKLKNGITLELKQYLDQAIDKALNKYFEIN